MNPGVSFSIPEIVERTGLKEATVKQGIKIISKLPNVFKLTLDTRHFLLIFKESES